MPYHGIQCKCTGSMGRRHEHMHAVKRERRVPEREVGSVKQTKLTSQSRSIVIVGKRMLFLGYRHCWLRNGRRQRLGLGNVGEDAIVRNAQHPVVTRARGTDGAALAGDMARMSGTGVGIVICNAFRAEAEGAMSADP